LSFPGLTFGCGTETLVEGLFVVSAYQGLQIGCTSEEVNEDMVRCRLADARRVFPWGHHHLVEPACHRDADGRPQLPAFCCAAGLWSWRPARDANRDCSGVVLVWFQESVDPVFGIGIRSWARYARWADVAQDGDW
jgi:hypothetical protein